MLKYILFIFLGLFIISCSDGTPQNTSQHLSISRAPVGGEPISIFQTLSLGFSTKLDATSVNNKSILLLNAQGQSLGCELQLNEPDNTQVVVIPNLYFQASQSYTLVVTTDVLSEHGLSLSNNYEYTFSTLSDASNPYGVINIVEASPSGLALMPILKETDITLEFDRYIAPSTVEMFNLIDRNDSNRRIDGIFEYFNSRVIFKPTEEFVLGHQYDINITNPPTDLYGNEYNTSGITSDSFVVSSELNSTAYIIDGNTTYNLGHDAYKIDMMYDTGVNILCLVVASEMGLEFLDINDTTFELTKQTFTLPLSSKVTSMQFVDDTGDLVVSTLNDGIYLLRKENGEFTYKHSIDTPANTYGVSFSIGQFGTLDRVYSVGPEYGLRVYDENLSFLFESDTNGSALSVYADGTDVYVADYKNGMIVFDNNANYQGKVNLNSTIKQVASDGSNIVGLSTTGNYFMTDGSSVSAVVSLLSSDISGTKTNSLSSTYIVDNMLIYYPQGSSEFFKIKTTGTIVSALDLSGGLVMVLNADGSLNLFVLGGNKPVI